MRGSIRAVRRLWEYCLLAVDIWRARRSELIIVREFSTYYLLVTAGLCLPLMRRVALVVNHNVQAAHNSALQRRLLILFARTGARYICLEDAAGCLEILPSSLHPAVSVMLHPLLTYAASGSATAGTQETTATHETSGAPAALQDPARGGDLVVGLAGDFRPEKGMHRVLEALCAVDLVHEEIRVHVGTPGGGTLPRAAVPAGESPAGDAPAAGSPAAESLTADRVHFFDTASSSAYVGFLRGVHVLVVPYPGLTYRHRSSGMIADACAWGTPVLATDLPAFRAQVLTPAQGGLCVGEECFASSACLQEALSDVRAGWTTYAAGVAANAQARSLDAIALSISRLLPQPGSASQPSGQQG